MKNFTKEYIKECDCEKIQGLRGIPELRIKLNVGDLFYDNFLKDIRIMYGEEVVFSSDIIWLPTGDQLDEEIIKILNKEKIWRYEIGIEAHFNWSVSFTILKEEKAPLGMGATIDKQFAIANPNPLIARIKLLKELLKKE